jgi:hypothetical protein
MAIKVKGISFAFNNEDVLVVPPLTIGLLEQLQQRISEVEGNAADPKQIATIIDTVHAALLRNYPEMTRDQVGALIDLGNMNEVFACVMDVSGMKRKALAEGEILGN